MLWWTGTTEEYSAIANFYETKSEFAKAGNFYRKSNEFPKALKLFLQCGDAEVNAAIDVVVRHPHTAALRNTRLDSKDRSVVFTRLSPLKSQLF